MRKLTMTMLAVCVGIVMILAACSESAKESPAPDADKVAAKVLEAIVDYDVAVLYPMLTESALENEKKPGGIPSFRDHTKEEILSEEAYDKGDFKKYTNDGDYIFGAYYGFLENSNRVLYLAEMYNNTDNTLHTKEHGDRKQYRFELVKEDEEWKIDSIRGWKKKTVKDKSDQYINYIFSEDEETKIFHRGGDYK